MRSSSRRIRATLLAAGVCAHVAAILVAGAGTGADAKTGPPPTPVNGTPSAFPSELHTPGDHLARPELRAGSALLADLDTGDVLYARGAGVRRPIASVSKVMTALIVLERTRPGDLVTVARDAVFAKDEYGSSSVVGLRAGERRTVRDLVYGALLGSANDAARALAIHVAGSEAAFVELMNQRAADLGMLGTSFASATGLDDRGRSTAGDLWILARTALRMPRLAKVVRTRFHEIPAPGGTERRIQNRNVLLWLYPGATGMKTGYTARAGFCLIGSAERDGRSLVVIVLRAPGEAFSDAAGLLNYGFEGFSHRTFVVRGEALGDVSLPGGSVPVLAGAALGGLVAVQDLGSIRFKLVADPLAVYPPRLGEVVGSYRVSTPGVTIGSVPLVVSGVPGPADPGDAPWWVRAVGAIAGAVGTVVGSLFG